MCLCMCMCCKVGIGVELSVSNTNMDANKPKQPNQNNKPKQRNKNGKGHYPILESDRSTDQSTIDEWLTDTDTVLGGSSSNVGWLVGIDEFLEQRLVLFFGQDCRIKLDIVFVQQILSNVGGNVEQGVAHSHQDSCNEWRTIRQKMRRNTYSQDENVAC